MDDDARRSVIAAMVDPEFHAQMVAVLTEAFELGRPPYMTGLLQAPKEQHGAMLGEAFSMGGDPDEEELDMVVKSLMNEGGYSRLEALQTVKVGIDLWAAALDQEEGTEAEDEPETITLSNDQREQLKALLRAGQAAVVEGAPKDQVVTAIERQVGRLLDEGHVAEVVH